ncbi:DMT family transporter [Agromyces cerinus]|uniref:EamA-like transporter family protein n=1 Tax=Agromyces cerinus subsp. cerinus TaxID=232089 RepID=A0A1N6HQ31_9MICO|nr:DMT family transporter [Agromyces cerinus]SIO21887.1 EamA-like transporter family protein [Agromyces cerinus subsp. cerinus]
MHRGRAYLALTLASLFWAGNYVFGEMVTAEISPVSLTFWRWAFAAIPLLVFAWAIERPDWRGVVREWPWHLLLSVLGLTGYTLFLYSALGLTGAVTASVISAINPATIALAAAIFLHERLRGVQVVGLVVAFLGVTVVLTGGDLLAVLRQGFRIGDLLVVGAVIVWSAYVIVSRRLATPPITATAVQAVIAVVTMLPLVAVVGIALPTSAAGIAGLAYIVIFPSMLGYAFWNLGAAAVGPARAGIFLNLLPVFTVLIALVLGQSLEPVAMAGGALVLLGVYLTLRVGRSKRADASADVTAP